MHMGKIIAESVLFALGAITFLFPSVMVRFQIWTQRVLMNAQYIPSKRTYTVMRFFGAFLIALGVIVIFLPAK